MTRHPAIRAERDDKGHRCFVLHLGAALHCGCGSTDIIAVRPGEPPSLGWDYVETDAGPVRITCDEAALAGHMRRARVLAVCVVANPPKLEFPTIKGV